MGQKTHPLGFRLGITQSHKSSWFSKLNQYAIVLQEDDKIRTFLHPLTKTAGISDIIINRNSQGDHIELNLETNKPGLLVGQTGIGIKTLSTNLRKILPSNTQIRINIIEVIEETNAALLANSIVKELENRTPFRPAIRNVMQRVENNANVNGIKVQVSGRLNGAEIARSEWFRENRVPLHTLKVKIDYALKEANTIFGILGVKVWLAP